MAEKTLILFENKNGEPCFLKDSDGTIFDEPKLSRLISQLRWFAIDNEKAISKINGTNKVEKPDWEKRVDSIPDSTINGEEKV